MTKGILYILLILLLPYASNAQPPRVVKALVGDTVLLKNIRLDGGGFGCGDKYTWYIYPDLYQNFSINYIGTFPPGADVFFTPKDSGFYKQRYGGYFAYYNVPPRGVGCEGKYYLYTVDCLAYPESTSTFMPYVYSVEMKPDFNLRRYQSDFSICYRNNANVDVNILDIKMTDTPSSRIKITYKNGDPTNSTRHISPFTKKGYLSFTVYSVEGPYENSPLNREIQLLITKSINSTIFVDTVYVGVDFQTVSPTDYMPTITPAQITMTTEVGNYTDTVVEMSYTDKVSRIIFDTLPYPFKLLEVEHEYQKKKIHIRFQPDSVEYSYSQILFPYEIKSFDTSSIFANCDRLFITYEARASKSITDNDHNILSVYPNPAKNTITVKTKKPDLGKIPLQLTDVLGNTVFHINIFSANGAAELTLDRKNLPNGLYYLSFIIDGKRYTEKLLLTN